MLSAGEQVRAFGAGADGFVDGEGVGAVVLKPLERAEEEGDHIYAVLKGSMINAGGKTNGYTVPNPQAQAEVIAEAMKRAGVRAEQISYVEAHGTGTELGDPIEVAGLSKAFGGAETRGKRKPWCALGTVKSNIGHTESAAGIAGLSKVVLQMQHGELVPTLYAQPSNPQIDFSKTPFVVQQEVEEWKRPEEEGEDGRRKQGKRRAGVSSFGAGGANAHVIVEEYEERRRERRGRSKRGPVVLVFSGKSQEQAMEQARGVRRKLEEGEWDEEGLRDIAYTLQVGREEKEERVAVVVRSVEEAVERMRRMEGEGVERGRVQKREEVEQVWGGEQERKEMVQRWREQGKWEKVAQQWVRGAEVEWEKEYEGEERRRVSLPGYPFVRERYWKPSGEEWGESGHETLSTLLEDEHPLVQRNTSTLREQRFESHWSGQEWFLRDHQVKGAHLLPGVASIEMAREALVQAMDQPAGSWVPMRLQHVTWSHALQVEAPGKQVQIVLTPQSDGTIGYTVQQQASKGQEALVYSQGHIGLAAEEEGRERLEVSEEQRQCPQQLDVEACYARLAALGIVYGAGLHGLRALWQGADRVLAEVEVPEVIEQEEAAARWGVHPAVMDAALQAAIGLVAEEEQAVGGAVVPFAVEQVELLGRSTRRMWAVLQRRERSGDGQTERIDVALYDEQGWLAVRLLGLSARRLGREGMPARASEEEGPAWQAQGAGLPVGTVVLHPQWEASEPAWGAVWPTEEQRVLIIGGDEQERRQWRECYPQASWLATEETASVSHLVERVQALGELAHVVWLVPNRQVSSQDEAIIAGQEEGVLGCFRTIKALLQAGYEQRELGWSVITHQTQGVHGQEEVQAMHASVHGLMGVLAKEYPHWAVRLVDVPANEEYRVEEVQRLPAEQQGNGWVYRGGRWYQQQLLVVEPAEEAAEEVPYREGGVYVVLGGAGGIGAVWSEHVIRKKRAQVIWIGRREVDEQIREKQERLASLGVRPEYWQIDARDREALERGYEEMKRRYGKINGVVHSALVLWDGSLGRMEEEQFRAGLEAKVNTSVHLWEVFGREELDFVLFFSSLNGVSKMAGQSNYVAGCTFEDAYAQQVGREWRGKVRTINWGYWAGVGRVAGEEYRERLGQAGYGSIEPEEGMRVVDSLLGGPIAQLALLKTTKPVALY
jgi:polyketide synthase PksM